MLSVDRSAEERPSRSHRDAGDEELVRRAQLGSAAAFEQLVLSHGPRLHRYLVVRLRDDSDARDALQETLAAAWRGLPSLKQGGKFWPWLVGIAAHKAADAARNRLPTSEQEIDLLAYEDESVFEIREAIEGLPAHYREVLLLRYRMRLSEREVAELLGVRVGTVKSRTSRARKALMELLR